jgi:hypothetical protein
MKANEIILEMPQLIDDLYDMDWNDHSLNRNIYNNFLRSKYRNKEKILQLSDFASIYKQGSEYFCLDSSVKRVTYFMKYQVSNNGILGQFVWQSLVWTDPEFHPIYLQNIPANIFFNHLLPKFHTIVTDSHQTWNGRRFWELRIADALHKNLNVYFFNFQNRELIPVKSYAELHEFQRKYDIWGAAPSSTMKRMVISDKELKS